MISSIAPSEIGSFAAATCAIEASSITESGMGFSYEKAARRRRRRHLLLVLVNAGDNVGMPRRAGIGAVIFGHRDRRSARRHVEGDNGVGRGVLTREGAGVVGCVGQRRGDEARGSAVGGDGDRELKKRGLADRLVTAGRRGGSQRT